MGNSFGAEIKPVRSEIERLCQYFCALEGDPSNIDVRNQVLQSCHLVWYDISQIRDGNCMQLEQLENDINRYYDFMKYNLSNPNK